MAVGRDGRRGSAGCGRRAWRACRNLGEGSDDLYGVHRSGVASWFLEERESEKPCGSNRLLYIVDREPNDDREM